MRVGNGVGKMTWPYSSRTCKGYTFMAAQKRIKSKKYSGVYYRENVTGKEKTFYIRYRVGGRDAKLIEEPVGKSSSGMTEAKANQIRMDRMRGKELPNTEKRRCLEEKKSLTQSPATLAKLWELYAEINVGKPILKTDASLFKYFPQLHDTPPNELTTGDIDALRIKLSALTKSRKKGGEEKALSAQTIKHILAFIRRLINFGVKRGWCPPQPSLYFEMPEVDNVKTEILTLDQIAKLKQVLDEEADQVAASLIRLALTTGMRKSALIALRWDDIDFVRGFITLRGDAAKKGKTEIIPMSLAARSVLEKLPKTSAYLFPGKNGGQRKDFRRVAIRVKRKAGLPDDFRPLHGLRHAYASLLASSGKVDLYTLQKLLTHSSPQMTQRYAHLADEAMQRAARVADEIFITAINNEQDLYEK